MSGKRLGIAGLVLMCSLLVTTIGSVGCGGSSSSTASVSPTSSSGADVATYADAQLAPFRQLPQFIAPGPAFDAKKALAGKVIFGIPGYGGDPFYKTIYDGMNAVANEVGVKFVVWNNQGQLSQYQQGISQAISQKVDLIDLLAGPNPSMLKPQIDAAQAAGILVVASAESGFGQTLPYVDGDLHIEYAKGGQLMADWVISRTKGNAHVLVLTSNEYPCSEVMNAGVKNEFDQYGGPNIKYTFANVPIVDWATKVGPAVRAAIVADPKLNYVIATYDSMSQFITPAIQAANLVGKVKIVGFNGTPFVIDMVREGKVEMDVGESLNWVAHGIMDAEMRLIAGLPPVENMHTPLFIFTKDNAASAGIPAGFSTGYGDSYKTEYRKLWGLTN